MDRWKSTIDGGFAISRSTNLPGAAMAMKPYLAEGKRTYLRHMTTGHVVTFRGLPPETIAHNQAGDPIAMPDWAEKAKRVLGH